MEPAPELIEFVEKWIQSWFVDFEHFADVFAHHAGTRFIGTDPDEWWEGSDTIFAVGRTQFSEMETLPTIGIDLDETVAWKEGSVGWVAVRCRASVGDADPRQARFTIVVHQEGAYWKVVHLHFSLTVPNQEVVGLELSTTVDELLLLVQNEWPTAADVSADGSVTIMFTDLEGSSALMESLGEERWFELLKWHDSIVKHKTAIFGGTVVKGQGDGFMLAFPAAGSAAACASAIQRNLSEGWAGVPVAARIGLHTGNAKAEAGDFFGRTVVVAARVSNIAEGGEILLSQAVQEELDGAFSLNGPRSTPLKGLAGVHTVFELVWNV